uniref:CUB domain-containing protein n=1 Tax=Heterorhabditis bacteriophora TaxID=37862 RepID=A0A1I7X9W0_HETBA
MYGGDKGADDSDRAMPGEHLDCFTRVFTVKEKQNSTDFYYELHFESTTKNSTTSEH